MNRSVFLARLTGPTFVAIGAGMLINQIYYQGVIAEGLRSSVFFYLSGLLSLLAGLAIVNLHNLWASDWRVIITVLGWLMVVGGVLRIVLPTIARSMGAMLYGGNAPIIVVGIITAVLGGFLTFKGYGQRAPYS